jgi:hypothetical protein
LDSFGRIHTFQLVTANPNEKFSFASDSRVGLQAKRSKPRATPVGGCFWVDAGQLSPRSANAVSDRVYKVRIDSKATRSRLSLNQDGSSWQKYL